MRWTKQEPIIQSEVSQKEKCKYHLLRHIYGIQKDGTDYFQGSNGETDIENRPMGTVGGEGGEEMYRESNIEIYNTICKIDSQGNLLCGSGNSNRGSATG